MPVIFQKFIYREDCQANPDVLYVFGDNTLRRGLGGQAGSMRGEPNAVGVATKWEPGMDVGDFFRDDDFDECVAIIEEDLKPVVRALEHGEIVVIPLDGLGTGLSQLPERAPKIDQYLKGRIHQLTKITSL